MNQNDPVFHKPKSIIAAKNIFYACLFIAFINVLIRDITLGFGHNAGFLSLIVTIIGFGIIIFLIMEIGLRKKWARTVLLLITICNLGAFYFVFKTGANMGVMEKILFIFRQVLQILGFIFLFRRESNQWFKIESQN
jgi:hypothetical protein